MITDTPSYQEFCHPQELNLPLDFILTIFCTKILVDEEG